MQFPKTGILGGGQLGLMMAQACSNWHFEPVFLDPDPKAPVRPYGECVMGSFRDAQSVLDFGSDKELLSFEIEDVSLSALKHLEAAGKKVFPQPAVLEIIQDKYRQKQFLFENGFPTSPVLSVEAAEAHPHFFPAFWKQNVGGYDGKGVQKVHAASDLQTLPQLPGFLEKAVTIRKELAVIVARNERGETAVFPAVEMVFHPTANLVEYLQTPADISSQTEQECRKIACDLVEKLGMVGLLAVEFFEDSDGRILVNEMAPRPHNSGHHTIEGFSVSQFEMYWRAILNLSLPEPVARFPFSAMLNLIGEPGHQGKPVYQGLEACLSQPDVFVHLYGKPETRPYRKMGHVSIGAHSLADLRQKVSFVQQHLSVVT